MKKEIIFLLYAYSLSVQCVGPMDKIQEKERIEQRKQKILLDGHLDRNPKPAAEIVATMHFKRAFPILKKILSKRYYGSNKKYKVLFLKCLKRKNPKLFNQIVNAKWNKNDYYVHRVTKKEDISVFRLLLKYFNDIDFNQKNAHKKTAKNILDEKIDNPNMHDYELTKTIYMHTLLVRRINKEKKQKKTEWEQ